MIITNELGTPQLNTVHHCDALKLLGNMASNSVDSVISDPPYGAKIADWDMDIPPQEILTECLRVSRGAVVWFGGRVTSDIAKVMLYAPIPDRMLIWHVTFSNSSVSESNIYYKWHPIYCWRLPKQSVIKRDVIGFPTAPKIAGVDHPAKKPANLMRLLVSAFGGDSILDPFAGSGTTLVAAQELGRDFIGCDISREYCDLMERRLAQPYTPMFAQMLNA